MRFFSTVFNCVALALSAACTSPIIPPTQPKVETSIVTKSETECDLLALAASMSSKNKGAILSGCPGEYQDYSVTKAEQNRFAETAANTKVPSSVSAQGLEYERLFVYLMLRGVSPNVALDLTTSPAFAEFAAERQRTGYA